MENYWDKRTKKYGHTGWADRIIYAYDQKVRLKVIKWIIDKYKPEVHEGGKALDYGGGSGDFTELLLGYCKKVLYYDVSSAVTQIAKKRFEKMCGVCGGGQSIQFLDSFEDKDVENNLDIILVITVIQHIFEDYDVDKLFNIFANKLNENGFVILLEDTFEDKENNNYICYRTIKQFESIIEKSGLKIMDVYGFYHPDCRPTQSYLKYRKSFPVFVANLLIKVHLNKLANAILNKYTLSKEIFDSVENYCFPIKNDDVSRIYILQKK